MRAYKITRNDGSTYYSRSLAPWSLLDRPGVAKVEEQPETPYVKAACIFYQGTAGEWKTTIAEGVIQRMVGGDCLWHAVASETGKRCYCADCEPSTHSQQVVVI